jgi:tol-pal system protein YbgF
LLKGGGALSRRRHRRGLGALFLPKSAPTKSVMFRQPLLPFARLLVVAFGLAIIGAPTSAWSQDRTTLERLDRVERDLNMLQRQVYRGAPPPPVAGGDGVGAVNTQIRMDRLEAQMRELTGRVEEFINQIEQIRQRVEQVAGDVDTRFSQETAGARPLAAAVPAPARPSSASPSRSARKSSEEPSSAADEAPMQPGTVVAPPASVPGVAAPVYGTLRPPGSVAAAVDPPGAVRSPAGNSLASGSAAEQYNHAFGLLKQADYPAAEAALKAFIEQHPTDPMAGNAQYWLGETYYTRSRYIEAASAFAEGYKRYPKSAKAAEDLLKLGMALGRANQKQNACLALAQLDRDFPNPGVSIKEHAGVEKKRLGC